ncbi:MAG: carboxypeptidase-like regulatory domain-containing protein [Acidobacteriaceae bacterium]
MNRHTRKFALCLLLALAATALAERSATVTGVVYGRDGVPLTDAIVEIFGANSIPVATAFTDMRGQYAFTRMAPGHYRIYVAQAFYMPVHRGNVLLRSGSHAVVDLTLTTLFDAAQWFPARPRPADEPADDWTWTLRTTANRPILRWSEDADASDAGTPTSQQRRHFASHARVNLAVVTGSRQFGDGGLRQQTFVRVDQGASSESIYQMQVAPTGGTSEFTAGYERDPMPGTIMRTVASYQSLPVVAGSGSGLLQIIELRSGEQISIGDLLMAQFGAESDLVQSTQSLAAVRPFASVSIHTGQDTQISYRMATATEMQSITDMAPSFSSVPQVAELDGALRMSRDLHQELAMQRQFHGAQLEAALFLDRMVDPVLNGYGDLSATEFAAGDVLLDPATGAFRSIGPGYSGSGVRVFASRPWNNTLWAAFEYTDGPALVLPVTNGASSTTIGTVLAGIQAGRAQSVLVSMRGKLPRTGAAWTAGYRWQPTAALTPVDAFNTGLYNPFLSVTLSQPLAYPNASPDRLVLLLEMQNILAQGYRSIYLAGASGVYFAQSARALTGGLAFSF